MAITGNSDYIFMYQEGTAVLQDEIARPFMECIIQPALTRIEGGGPSAIYNATINKFNQEINLLWGSPDPIAGDMITYLIHDRDNFMVTGVYAPVAVNLPVLIGGLALTHFVFGFP